MNTPRWPVTTAIFCTLCTAAHAQTLPIYGGPARDSNGGGYQDGYFGGNTVINDAGTVAATSTILTNNYADIGLVAVRWDASGASSPQLDDYGLATYNIYDSRVNDINAQGAVIGVVDKDIPNEFDNGTGDRAVRWDASGKSFTELGHIGALSNGYTESRGLGINDAGAAVGFALKAGPEDSFKGDRAVRWDANTTQATELGHLGLRSNGYTNSRAGDINNAGTAIGIAEKYDATATYLGRRAVRWDADSTVAVELGNLGTGPNGSTESYAIAINRAGTIAGTVAKYGAGGSLKGGRAVRWNAGSTTAIELGNISEGFNGVASSRAININEGGLIVGYAAKYEPDDYGFLLERGTRAVRWDTAGYALELEHLNTDLYGKADSRAWDINEAGLAVGFADLYNDDGTQQLGTRALAWDNDGVAIDLTTLLEPDTGWVSLDEARGVNNHGWITGVGTFDPDGDGTAAAYKRMFLLDASSLIPEPATAVLLGMAGFCISSHRSLRITPQRH